MTISYAVLRERQKEGRVHERPQTGTPQAVPACVSPQRSHLTPCQVRAFRSACVLPSVVMNANYVPVASQTNGFEFQYPEYWVRSRSAADDAATHARRRIRPQHV